MTNVRDLHIEDEMKDSYLTYAMSVIVSRALPDVRDGLKPSQRRILVAMNDLNLGPRAKHRKCAKICGDTSGNYHPHGESVIYPTLVRMGQDWSLRVPLVHPQGNFGSLDGDPPAAMRYTEARLAAPATELLADIDEDTVDFVRNYDDTRDEPTVLPAKLPNLLVNGSDGIAVGMASSMLPHNLVEVCKAVELLLDNPEATVSEILEVIPGPDFPTGGIVCGRKGISVAYQSGRGTITLRGRHHVEEDSRGRQRLIFTEIPYQLKKEALLLKIADQVKEGRISGISNLNDESGRKEKVRIVVELKRGEDPEVVLNQLWKHTPLQSTQSIINIALVDRRPRTLSIRDMLVEYIRHRREVIRRRTEYRLRKARERAHIVEGLLKALDSIDEVIRTIREAPDVPTAAERLQTRFELSAIQADHILRMQLRTLTALEHDKLKAEYDELMTRIRDLEDILADPIRVREIIREDVREMAEKHGTPRLTEISAHEITNVDIGDLIQEETVVVTISHEGYVKRVPASTYRAQGRGGRGITGTTSKEEDFTEHLFVASSHALFLFFTNKGKVHWRKAYQLPEGSRASRGRALVNILSLEEGERIASVLPIQNFADHEGDFALFATRLGYVKKTKLSDYSRPRSGSIWAIKLEDDDSLVGVRVVKPDDTVILGTRRGQAIQFHQEGVRTMGRFVRGVRGIRFKREADELIGMSVCAPDRSHETLLTISQNGYGKRTEFADYRLQNRGGSGIVNLKISDKTGPVAAILDVHADDDLMIVTDGGMIIRTRVEEIRVMGRSTQGVRVINLKQGELVAGVGKLAREEEEVLPADPESPLPADPDSPLPADPESDTPEPAADAD